MKTPTSRNSADFPTRLGRTARSLAPRVALILQRHGVVVHRWRRTMSGCAWSVLYDDGSTCHLIEAPFPKTPLSFAVFLHEIGHHAIGFDRYPLSCEEEYHAWQWALAQMRIGGIAPDERVMNRYRLSMRYAVAKARRRGLRKLPAVLRQFGEAA